MSTIDEAGRRLDGALLRLEELIDRQNAETAELRGRLEAAETEVKRLQGLLDQVAGRVEGAAERLRGVLAEED